MRPIEVKAAAILDAPSEDVYATIADYRQGHPQILPKGSLYNLQVEQGGYGDGTIIRFKARALGVVRSFYQRVSEPVPGTVLVEQDIDPIHNVVTTFTVTSMEQAQMSHVEILHTENASPGLQGFIERLINPLVMTPILRKELQLLESVARQRASLEKTSTKQ
ncbi:SRPBCC family protein [Dictyobacter formicarum]|nr:SRPBCC family protein [Dictyobacter formicarum]